MIFNTVLNKVSVASLAWLLVIIATGLITSVDSLKGWMMVSVLAIGPGAVLLHFARELPRTTSETIQAARR
jgi:membrane protein required for beta-lactamase induction